MGDLSRNFSKAELACSHCGSLGPWSDPFKVQLLEDLRDACGFSLPITSGYRCSEHPLEKVKSEPGEHTRLAVDIGVSKGRALILTVLAYGCGWSGIGWKQHGDGRFVHLDRGEPRPTAPRPACWSYPGG